MIYPYTIFKQVMSSHLQPGGTIPSFLRTKCPGSHAAWHRPTLGYGWIMMDMAGIVQPSVPVFFWAPGHMGLSENKVYSQL